jgi:Dyp-type peroxidase family
MTTTLPQLLQNVGAPIDDLREYQALLEDLQANIISSHGQPCAHYFFLTFDKGGVRDARQVLTLLAHGSVERGQLAEKAPDLRERFHALFGALENVHVTSEWEASTEKRRKGRDTNRFPVLVMISKSGYAKLGGSVPDDQAFRAGMEARGELLNDPQKRDWAAGYSETTFDALVVLAADPTNAQYESVREALSKLLGPWCVHKEFGFTMRDRNSDPIEPFGFRDHLSQPLFYARDLERVKKFQGKAADPKGGRWRTFEPLSSVLVPDPNGDPSRACGTYVVFRKLRQDVEAFTRQVQELASKLDRPPGEVAADLVGRTREGWPLAKTDDPDNMNDFDFSSGSRCPLHAHIRKANPREARYAPHQRRIVRRGLAYREKNAQGAPVETGLLFVCAQSNIEKQFETIQRWLNDTIEGGADPIAGQPRHPNNIALRDRQGNLAGRIHTFEATVSLRGGEYFFMPSLSAIKALSNF